MRVSSEHSNINTFLVPSFCLTFRHFFKKIFLEYRGLRERPGGDGQGLEVPQLLGCPIGILDATLGQGHRWARP